MTDVRQRLHGSRLFERVPASMVEALLSSGVTQEFQPGQRLLVTGEENTNLYLIASGAVAVHVASRPYLRLGPGECVGEMSVIDQSRVSADVVAVEPTVVVSVSQTHLMTLIDSSAEAARNLLRILASRVRHGNIVLAESDRIQLELEQIAMVDAITGLRNRRWLDTVLQRQFSRTLGEGQPVTALMIDLDLFKHVNDTQGHAGGDAVLRQVAQRLADALRPQDLIARYGGDEFVVLLPDTDTEEALIVAERLREMIQHVGIRVSDQQSETMTISVGLATIRDPDSLRALLTSADAALYRAKRDGRNRVTR
jgi:diguanylate cyclase (GGDEF)-like protein